MFTHDKKRMGFIMISLLLLVSLLSATFFVTTADARAKKDSLAFHDAMRQLWEDHITWTRLVIVSIANDLPDTKTTVERLLQNQVDIGNAIKPFYGEDAGNELTTLLTAHITIAAEILQAAKSGNETVLNDAIARWYANADEIAVFLNSLNPHHWPLDEMQAMMKEHLDLTLQEAVAYLEGDYEASVAAYDLVHIQALEMADMLSEGIVRQFPKMFK